MAADPAAYTALIEEAQSLRGRRRIAKYEEALAANPNGVEALTELAWFRLNRGQNEQAAQYAERASTLDPTNSKAWITLGAARQALGNASGAREAYQACVDQGQGRYVSDCRLML